MAIRFTSGGQQDLFRRVLSELSALGYKDDLLQESYRFEDWFSIRSGDSSEFVTADAAAFGRRPLGHDNSCFAVGVAGDVAGHSLISRFRSLGAPLAFEITNDEVLLWQVRANGSGRSRPLPIPPQNLREAFASHSDDWSPAAILRAKNIAPSSKHGRQLDFIDIGLIPALEEHIREKLDPLLRRTFFAAMDTYAKRKEAQPSPGSLFRLVFRVLAGKVLVDRGVPSFQRFTRSPDPNELLAAVNAHFGDKPRLIADAETRRAVVDRLWNAFSLQHISAAVLSMIWENTLVDDKVRKEVGLYGTPMSVARYMVDRIGLDDAPQSERYVVEPCCGSGVFLLAAMQRLAALLDPGQYADSQHDYLKSMLSGFDSDPFGLEVARDCLMLADFPNSNGWALEPDDVFESPRKSPLFHEKLRGARFLFCNPPFTPPFSETEKRQYGVKSPFKPVELLGRVLKYGRKLLALGFVLPHQVLSGQSYRDLRRLLAERFDTIEALSLPEKGVFSLVEYGAVAIIARHPKDANSTTTLVHSAVSSRDWAHFAATRETTREERRIVSADEASDSILVPDLADVWTYVRHHKTLASAIRPLSRRGIQWNKTLKTHRDSLIVDREQPGHARGIPSAPRRFFAYLCPPTKFLSVKEEDQDRQAFDLPWHLPKVIVNSNRKGRGPWRIAAFADRTGLIAYHTFKGLWPSGEWSAEVIAAILNGPLASAFAAVHETGPDISNEVMDNMPLPYLTQSMRAHIEELVRSYIAVTQKLSLPTKKGEPEAERILVDIDAAVLQGYDLPPRLERKLLDYFNDFGDKRPVGFPTGNYFPQEYRPAFSLADYRSQEFREASAKEFKKNRALPSEAVLAVLRALLQV